MGTQLKPPIMLVEDAGDGAWDWDWYIQSGKVIHNRSWCVLLGLDESKLGPCALPRKKVATGFASKIDRIERGYETT